MDRTECIAARLSRGCVLESRLSRPGSVVLCLPCLGLPRQRQRLAATASSSPLPRSVLATLPGTAVPERDR